MRFTKSHGAGNDFILVDSRGCDRAWPELARAMCERHFGVGADGIILVDADGPRLRMRMFNPDGSEAEACGNGLRCFVKYVVDAGIARSDYFTVDTLGGPRHVVAVRNSRGEVDEAQVSMGAPSLEPAAIPAVVSGRSGPVLDYPVDVGGRMCSLSLVSMGNPHAVTFVDEATSGYPLHSVGPLVERHAMFPSRVNFEVARVLAPGVMEARVWERGAGETLACGTGACAVAVAARLHGFCGDVAAIQLPGGELTVTWKGDGEEVLLRGPVREVFTGDWPD